MANATKAVRDRENGISEGSRSFRRIDSVTIDKWREKGDIATVSKKSKVDLGTFSSKSKKINLLGIV